MASTDNQAATSVPLREKYLGAVEHFLNINNEIEAKLTELDKKLEQWRKVQAVVEANAKNMKQKIKLDVGGKIFATSKTSLLRFEGSYFHALISSGHWEPDEDGAYFIDRNPKNFDVIIDYMRDGVLRLDRVEPSRQADLLAELDYYQLPLPSDKTTCK